MVEKERKSRFAAFISLLVFARAQRSRNEQSCIASRAHSVHDRAFSDIARSLNAVRICRQTASTRECRARNSLKRENDAAGWTIPAERCRDESCREEKIAREEEEEEEARGKESARQSALERIRIIWKARLGVPIRHSRLTRRSNSNQPPLNPTPRARRTSYCSYLLSLRRLFCHTHGLVVWSRVWWSDLEEISCAAAWPVVYLLWDGDPAIFGPKIEVF